MTVAQVEQIVGSLKVGEKSGSLHDMLNALPRLPAVGVAPLRGWDEAFSDLVAAVRSA